MLSQQQAAASSSTSVPAAEPSNVDRFNIICNAASQQDAETIQAQLAYVHVDMRLMAIMKSPKKYPC